MTLHLSGNLIVATTSSNCVGASGPFYRYVLTEASGTVKDDIIRMLLLNKLGICVIKKGPNGWGPTVGCKTEKDHVFFWLKR